MPRALLALVAAAITVVGAHSHSHTTSTASIPAHSAASIPAHPRWKSSGRQATWDNRGFTVYNNEWNQSAGAQTVWADSYRHWGVQSTQQAGNTAVETYPCVGKYYGSVPVSSLRKVQNSFTESMPAGHRGLHAEAADDVWLNNYGLEMMIWVDNIGQSFGGDNLVGHARIDGQKFAIWRNGTEFIFALNHNETRGQTDILSSVRWLIKHHFAPSSSTLTQVDFGWEISSTNGHAEDFTVTNYGLRTQRS